MSVRLFTKSLTQTIVYWGTPMPDGWGGQTYSDPVEINARWENKQELFIDADGNEVKSRAVVYVSQDLDIGSYVYNGKLIDLNSSHDADTQAGAYQVKAFAKIPDIKGVYYMRKAWLQG